MAADLILVRPCDPGTYPCARYGCDKWATTVSHVRVQPNGMASSVAFYGACDDHQ